MQSGIGREDRCWRIKDVGEGRVHEDMWEMVYGIVCAEAEVANTVA